MWLDERRAGSGGRNCPRGEEGRPARTREVEVETAADLAQWRTGPAALGSDRVPVGLAPHGVVESHRPAELGQLGPAGYPVEVQPTVGGFELSL